MRDADAERGEAFADRFALAPLGRGGVALDRRTGAFWQLDGAAWAAAERLAAGEPESSVVAALPLPEPAARALIADVLGLASAPEPPPGDNPVSFSHEGDGHLLRWEGAPLVRVGPAGLWLEAAAPAEDPVAQARLALPDLLLLRGRAVLHAAAALDRGQLRAFLGTSGSGKTTIGRAFAAAGARLVAEDLLLLEGRSAPLDGEARLRDWCERAGAAFGRGERATLSEADLVGFHAGPSAELAAIHVLGPRGPHPDLRCAPLAPPQAVAALLRNALAELGLRSVWERVWADAIGLAQAVPVLETSAPEGLDALGAAARARAWVHTSISTA